MACHHQPVLERIRGPELLLRSRPQSHPPSSTSKTPLTTTHWAPGDRKLPDEGLLSLQDIISGPKSHTNSHKPKACEVTEQAPRRRGQLRGTHPRTPSNSLTRWCPLKGQSARSRVTASFPSPQGCLKDELDEPGST